MIMKPFLKWAGGKGQLLNDIKQQYPSELGNTIKKYAEPFVGGGAVLFDILSNYNMEEIYISDINFELINTYISVRDNLEELIFCLLKMQNEFINLLEKNRKQYYYNVREQFNKLKIYMNKTNCIELAVLFIFLNKTCFNGLYRVNKKGEFNVPMGSYKKPCICDQENLRNISVALQNVEIKWGDYRESKNFIDSKTFVYFDPPYRPISQTASFTAYAEEVFDDAAQIELSEYIYMIDRIGAKVILSNSDPKNIDNNDIFFDKLYKRLNISRVQAKRMINCNGKFRGQINELLIANY